MSIAVLLDDAGHDALRCACVDRVTGAVWIGTDRGALVRMPREDRWRRVKLDGRTVTACAPGARGVCLAGPSHLFAPDAGGSGVARYALRDAIGHDAEVAGLAADRGGLWIALRGTTRPVPSLLRLPLHPPVFQRFHARLARQPGAIEAIGGDGQRAWALGPGWVTELEERSVVRPSALEDAPAAPASGAAAELPTSPPDVADLVAAMFRGRWLRAHAQGLVGRNADGLFCASHSSGQLLCPRLPGRIDAIATDWLGVAGGGMFVGTTNGAWFVDSAGALRSVVPDEAVVAVLPGPPIVVVTRRRVLALDAADLRAAPVGSVDLSRSALALARACYDRGDVRTRLAAVLTLELLGDETDGVAVAGRLRDTDATVRAAACAAVPRLAPHAARDLLVRAMGDPSTLVQTAAIGALRGTSAA